MINAQQAARLLEWPDVRDGEIQVTRDTATKRARTIELESVCPTVTEMLEGMRPEKATGQVWSWTRGGAAAFAKKHGFRWQVLRRTCGTFLTNALGIFGAASAYRSARQLGHSVAVAEAHYLGVVKVPASATTLEAAMGLTQ